MDKQLINSTRTGLLAGLLIAVTIANFFDYDMLWSCAIGLVGGALIGLVIGLIKRARK
ncbi:MAG: hypothetical protein IJ279_02145 [Clostridia bacterium]|nr:hypothetical protein [Clostridia bacterium]